MKNKKLIWASVLIAPAVIMMSQEVSANEGNAGEAEKSAVPSVAPITADAAEDQLESQPAAEIYVVHPDTVELNQEAPQAELTVMGRNLTNEMQLEVKDEQDQSVDEVIDYQVTGEKSGRKQLKITARENTSGVEKRYKVYPYYGDINHFSEYFDLKIAPFEAVQSVTSFTSKMTTVKADGATVMAVIKGHDMKKESLTYDLEINETPAGPLAFSYLGSFSSETGRVLLEIPANETYDEQMLKIKLKYNDKVVSDIEPLKLVQQPKELPAEKLTLKPVSAYFNEDYSRIEIGFNEPVMAHQSLEDIYQKVRLSIADAAGGRDYKPLETGGSVSLEADKLSISLPKAVEKTQAVRGVYVKLLPGALTNSKGDYNSDLEKLVESYQASQQAEIRSFELNQQLFSADGGTLEVLLKGENLSLERGTRIRLINPEKAQAEDSLNQLIKYEPTESGIKAKLQLPANNRQNPLSYIVQMYHNHSQQYYPRLEESADRGGRVAVTVQGQQQSDQPQISFVRISSYERTPDPNNLTHTVTARGQSSKKTYLDVYGMNLDADRTKVKIIDQNGVAWPIVSAGGTIQGSYPKMIIGEKGNGIVGNGTYQFIEVILPENLQQDLIFKYILAPDGVNYDEEYTTTALVEQTQSIGLDVGQVTTLTVNYQDQDERNIKESQSFTGYSWFDYKVEPEQIEGYQYVSATKDLQGKLGDHREITLRYQSEKPAVTKLVLTITKDDKPLVDSPVELSQVDSSLPIPSKIGVYKTDPDGKLVLENLKASAYQLKMANKTYKFDQDLIDFVVDTAGVIVSLDNQTVTTDRGYVEFKVQAFDKGSEEMEKHPVKLFVIDEAGHPVAGVPITANTITPNLAGYQDVVTDEMGMASFALEGQSNGKLYSMTVSKMGQFEWEPVTDQVMISVAADGSITQLAEDMGMLLMIVKYHDQRHLLTKLRDQHKAFVDLIADPRLEQTDKGKALKSQADEYALLFAAEYIDREIIPGYAKDGLAEIADRAQIVMDYLNSLEPEGEQETDPAESPETDNPDAENQPAVALKELLVTVKDDAGRALAGIEVIAQEYGVPSPRSTQAIEPQLSSVTNNHGQARLLLKEGHKYYVTYRPNSEDGWKAVIAGFIVQMNKEGRAQYFDHTGAEIESGEASLVLKQTKAKDNSDSADANPEKPQQTPQEEQTDHPANDPSVDDHPGTKEPTVEDNNDQAENELAPTEEDELKNQASVEETPQEGVVVASSAQENSADSHTTTMDGALSHSDRETHVLVQSAGIISSQPLPATGEADARWFTATSLSIMLSVGLVLGHGYTKKENDC